jgi:hypothetical protein
MFEQSYQILVTFAKGFLTAADVGLRTTVHQLCDGREVRVMFLSLCKSAES